MPTRQRRFTLTNYSSEKVVGTVKFEPEEALAASLASKAFVNNGQTIDTMVNEDHSVDGSKKTNVPSNTITATLKFNADEFAKLAATSSATMYGKYTVTINKEVKKLELTEKSGGSRCDYVVTSNLVFDGDTWDEIIANNAGKTVKLELYEWEESGTLTSSSDGYVILESDKENHTFHLFKDEISEAVKTTDSVASSLLFMID